MHMPVARYNSCMMSDHVHKSLRDRNGSPTQTLAPRSHIPAMQSHCHHRIARCFQATCTCSFGCRTASFANLARAFTAKEPN